MSEKNKNTNKINNKIKKALAKGYFNMGSVNLALADEAVSSDNDSLLLCEQNFAESEKIDSETRRYLLR